VLSRYSGTRYLVLGDMAELGEDAESLHASVGAYAKQCGIDGIWTTGPLSSHACKAFKGTLAVGGSPSYSPEKTSSETPVSLTGATPKADVNVKRRQSTGGHFVDQEALVKDIKPLMDDGVTVLVKGSRGSKMERVVKALMPSTKPLNVTTPEHSL